jgi:hypothetical protein
MGMMECLRYKFSSFIPGPLQSSYSLGLSHICHGLMMMIIIYLHFLGWATSCAVGWASIYTPTPSSALQGCTVHLDQPNRREHSRSLWGGPEYSFHTWLSPPIDSFDWNYRTRCSFGGSDGTSARTTYSFHGPSGVSSGRRLRQSHHSCIREGYRIGQSIQYYRYQSNRGLINMIKSLNLLTNIWTHPLSWSEGRGYRYRITRIYIVYQLWNQKSCQ